MVLLWAVGSFTPMAPSSAEEAASILPSLPSPESWRQPSTASVAVLLQQGQALYRVGQWEESATALQQAIEMAQVQGDTLQLGVIFSNLSLVYQQLGRWDEAKTAIAQSLDTLQSSFQTPDPQRLPVLAQALDIQGHVYLSTDNGKEALDAWQQAEILYEDLGDRPAQIRSQLNQVKALQELGRYSLALERIQSINQTLQSQPDSPTQVIGLQMEGELLLATGNSKAAHPFLENGLAIAQRLKLPTEQTTLLISLGTLARIQNAHPNAHQFFQQAEAIAPTPSLKLRTQLQTLNLLISQENWGQSQALLESLPPLIEQLPSGSTAIYARVQMAKSWLLIQSQVAQGQPLPPSILTYLTTALTTAIEEAQNLGSPRAESHALGTLGTLYEHTQQFTHARRLTEQALSLSQAATASELTYRWQWQLGRILGSQTLRRSQLEQRGMETNDSPDRSPSQSLDSDTQNGAIAAYQGAVDTLKTLRHDLYQSDSEAQFTFRTDVEPIYHQLIRLLLENHDENPDPSHLEQVRETLIALQVAELDNLLREACLDIQPISIDQVDPHAAVIYPILMGDRLEILVSLPKKPLVRYTTQVDQQTVEQTIREFLRWVRDPRTVEYLPHAQQLYDWLIRPAKPLLDPKKTHTLVFVLDGPLRNLPLAALHDGERYLLETYNLALTPGLELLDPRPLKREELKALAAGLSTSPDYPPLPFVQTEVQEINATVQGTVLLNQQFTQAALQTSLEETPFPIVHLATHGQFSSTPNETFLVAWDTRLTPNDLSTLLNAAELRRRSPIELLVLSACETAKGDSRAGLGLAGVAVKAGARSTLATLWRVDDEGTANLMTTFYDALTNPAIAKAAALRQAQLSILKDQEKSSPYYWAPYVLVGNWL